MFYVKKLHEMVRLMQPFENRMSKTSGFQMFSVFKCQVFRSPLYFWYVGGSKVRQEKFHFWETVNRVLQRREYLGTKKRNESKRNGNVPKISEIWGTEKSFPLSLPGGRK